MIIGGKHPRVSVLMPVYNGERYLREAIESILAQSFSDFEFLIVNDGSTDRSAEIAASYSDPRIRLIHNEVNCGLIASLNKGLRLASGEYVARMDCDDISLPDRLQKQVRFMDANHRVGVCGAWFRKFGAGREKTVRWKSDPDGIRCGLLFDAMVGHPTVMLRRALFLDCGLLYDPAYKNAEDYELWVRALEHCELANFPEVLLRYRVHPDQITRSSGAGQRDTAEKVRLAQLERLDISGAALDLEIHQAISTCVSNGVENLHERAEAWLLRLKRANERTAIYPEPAFSRELMERWLVLCKKSLETGRFSLRAFCFPRLLRETGVGVGYVLRFLLQQLRNR